ncbi:MAG: hypothetical protein WAT26_07180, partial [Saprospiraceae bacterium]
MKHLGLLLMIVMLYSCGPQVRKITDTVKNEETFIAQMSRSQSSKIDRNDRSFDITIKNKSTEKGHIIFEINSTFPVTQQDFQDSAYIVMRSKHYTFPSSKKGENIKFKEKIDVISNTTKTNVDVKTENKTTPLLTTTTSDGVNTRSTDSKTETTTTTTTSTSTDTDVKSEILDKIKSERIIKIPNKVISECAKENKLIIRIYTQDMEDYWDLKFV